MKPLSDMTPQEMEAALHTLEEDVAAVQKEEMDYLVQRTGLLSGQAARRYDVRLEHLRARIEAIREALRRGEQRAGDLP